MSLRLQINRENASEFGAVLEERAFADYLFCSLLLYFVVANFIG